METEQSNRLQWLLKGDTGWSSKADEGQALGRKGDSSSAEKQQRGPHGRSKELVVRFSVERERLIKTQIQSKSTIQMIIDLHQLYPHRDGLCLNERTHYDESQPLDWSQTTPKHNPAIISSVIPVSK